MISSLFPLDFFKNLHFGVGFGILRRDSNAEDFGNISALTSPIFQRSLRKAKSKNQKKCGRSSRGIISGGWAYFWTPLRDLKWSIYRVKNAVDCLAPYMLFFLQFVTHFPIGNSRFIFQVDVLWFPCEKLKNLALFGNRVAVGSFAEAIPPLHMWFCELFLILFWKAGGLFWLWRGPPISRKTFFLKILKIPWDFFTISFVGLFH